MSKVVCDVKQARDLVIMTWKWGSWRILDMSWNIFSLHSFLSTCPFPKQFDIICDFCNMRVFHVVFAVIILLMPSEMYFFKQSLLCVTTCECLCLGGKYSYDYLIIAWSCKYCHGLTGLFQNQWSVGGEVFVPGSAVLKLFLFFHTHMNKSSAVCIPHHLHLCWSCCNLYWSLWCCFTMYRLFGCMFFLKLLNLFFFRKLVFSCAFCVRGLYALKHWPYFKVTLQQQNMKQVAIFCVITRQNNNFVNNCA